jgi:U3 small nucleolar RNA-associated protein 21
VSACGNFAIIGYDSGHVDRFNMQSSAHRMAYTIPVEDLTPLARLSRAVRGVASDALNQVVIAAVSNKKLYFWKFKTGEIVKESEMYASPSFMHIHRQG